MNISISLYSYIIQKFTKLHSTSTQGCPLCPLTFRLWKTRHLTMSKRTYSMRHIINPTWPNDLVIPMTANLSTLESVTPDDVETNTLHETHHDSHVTQANCYVDHGLAEVRLERGGVVRGVVRGCCKRVLWMCYE